MDTAVWFNDLREFLSVCKDIDKVQVLKGVHWQDEMGMLVEAMAEKQGPILLFDDIPGYPSGFRVVGNVFHTLARTALAMRLPNRNSGLELLNLWRNLVKEFQPIPVREVTKGSVCENVDEDGAVNLLKFPAPRWHSPDGGRYLGTGGAVITRDPEDDRINLGTYRCMVQGDNLISVKLNKGKHGRLAMEKYHSKGQPCPIAISFGHDPTLFVAATTPLPQGINEYEFTGWLRKEPVEVMMSKITGLPLPAHAEIVAEGFIPPPGDILWPKEGPFGEWPGYSADTTEKEVPVAVIKRILYRNDPIILGVPPLRPPYNIMSIPQGAGLVMDQLEKAGIPDIQGVWGFVYGAQSGPFTVLSIKQRYPGHAKQAGVFAATCRAGAYGGKVVVVVDEDIDITDPQEVLWAIGTRCDVEEGLQFLRDIWTSPADPAILPEERAKRNYVSDRLIIYACKPYQWRDEFPKVNKFSDAEKQRVLKKFGLADRV